MSKRLLNMFWGIFLEKILLPSVRWKVEFSKFFQKIKKISNFQDCLKSFTKVSKHVLNMFCGNFFENFICPVSHGGSSLRNVFMKSKIFQNSKNAQNRSQIVQKSFEHVLGKFFWNFYLPSVPWRVESSKCF